jgi:hypothetical protein
VPSACAGYDGACDQIDELRDEEDQMDRPEFLNRSGSITNNSKLKLSAFFVVAGLIVMPLALNARAQTPAHLTQPRRAPSVALPTRRGIRRWRRSSSSITTLKPVWYRQLVCKDPDR